MITFKRRIDVSLVLVDIHPDYTEEEIAEMLSDGTAQYVQSESVIIGQDDIELAKVQEYSEDDIEDSEFESE